MRQQELVLTNGNNSQKITLQFTCKRMTILNNTSNDVYINRSSITPTANSKDYVVKAATNGIPGNVVLPQNSSEYAFFLPTSPALTDTSQVVTILLEGDDQQTRHFRELLLNTLDTKKKSF